MKIYVASSWKNDRQPSVVDYLREAGHEVYDFRNPHPGDLGFHWSEIDKNWENWTVPEYLLALDHPIADGGFRSDFEAMKWAEAFILVLPCGRSSHLELGWAIGMGKPTCILLADEVEPELMYKLVDKVAGDLHSVNSWLMLRELSRGSSPDDVCEPVKEALEGLHG